MTPRTEKKIGQKRSVRRRNPAQRLEDSVWSANERAKVLRVLHRFMSAIHAPKCEVSTEKGYEELFNSIQYLLANSTQPRSQDNRKLSSLLHFRESPGRIKLALERVDGLVRHVPEGLSRRRERRALVELAFELLHRLVRHVPAGHGPRESLGNEIESKRLRLVELAFELLHRLLRHVPARFSLRKIRRLVELALELLHRLVRHVPTRFSRRERRGLVKLAFELLHRLVRHVPGALSLREIRRLVKLAFELLHRLVSHVPAVRGLLLQLFLHVSNAHLHAEGSAALE